MHENILVNPSVKLQYGIKETSGGHRVKLLDGTSVLRAPGFVYKKAEQCKKSAKN